MKKILLTGILFMYSLIGILAQCPSPIPTSVSLTQNPSGPICAGTSVTFTTASKNGGTPTYVWLSSVTGIITSTSNTYISNSLVDGEVISVNMTSSLACASPATATANLTMVVLDNVTPTVTLMANQSTICPGQQVTYTAISTNGGTPTYTWDGTPTAAGTGDSYTTTLLPFQNSISVTVHSTLTCVTSSAVPSNPVVVTLTPTPTISVSITADKTTSCAGSPVTFTATVTGTGATPAPNYEWFYTSSSTANAGISTGPASTTANTFTTSALTATTNKVYVNVISNAACAIAIPVSSNVISTAVHSGISGGMITADQTICYNTSPLSLTEASASDAISPSYTWEASASGTVWSAIPGTAGKTFAFPTPLTQDIYLRRTVTDANTPAPCNVAMSNVVHITVKPELSAGVIGLNETICAGSVPTTVSHTTLPIGGTGSYTYQWQSDNGIGTFSDIAGAINPSYSPGQLAKTTLFRCIENSVTCGARVTNIVVKTVSTPEVVAVSLNDPGQVCDGSALTFTATATSSGSGTLIYAWSLNGNAVGTNSSSFVYTPLINDAGKTLTVVVTTSSACNTGPATVSVLLDVVSSSVPTVSISATTSNICKGLPIKFSVINSVGGGTSPIYQWFVKDISGAITSVGSGDLTYSSADLADGDSVYVALTSNLPCKIGTNPYKSNKIALVIRPIPAPVIIEGDQTICAGESFTFNATVGIGTLLNWELNGVAIPHVIENMLTATQEGIYTIREENGICSVTSAPVLLIVDPCGAFSSTIAGPNPITPGQQNAVYSVPDQTDFTYNWSVTGGTIVSGQNTHAVTVDWDGTATNAFARTAIPAQSISVTETNPDKQTKTTSEEINTITTAVVQSLAQSGIKVFPNPTTESFSIHMPESNVAVAYEIVDLTGVSVTSGTFTSTGSNQKIEADFNSGMYQIILKYNDTVTTARLSKVQ